MMARLSRVDEESTEVEGSIPALSFASRGEALRIARLVAGATPGLVYLNNE
jgi:hypothetical protein